MVAIESESLRKTYRKAMFGKEKIVALEGLSLTVNAGEIFGFLGPNGSGKTTFIKLLLGSAVPDKGDVRIFGRPVGDTSTKRFLGYLPEDYSYEPFLTGNQFLDCYSRMSLLPATERKKSWSYVVDLLGLRSFSNQRISGYSKGMRQRLGIAHALLNRPRLLLLDEPTDGLDPVGRRDVRDLLRATREEGCTMFINSHLLSEIEQLCDRVAILNSGKLVRIGTIDELTRSSGGYIVRISRSMIDSLPAMPAACSVQLLSNATEISVPNAQMLDQLVDLLRSHGVHIESIALERSTLEQAFIQIVTDRESPKEP